MVTNLPAEAKAKWLKYMEAKTTEEKIKALEEFLSAVPKHKGTENLVYWAKRRLAELKEEAELQKRKSRSTGRGPQFIIEKEGAGQVLLVGDYELRRELMVKLTGVTQEPETAPVPGMMYYEDVPIQLVNPPPFSLESKTWSTRLIALARNADAVLFAVRTKEEFQKLVELFEGNNVLLRKPKGRVVIEKNRYGSTLNLVIMGKLIGSDERELREFLKSYGIKSGTVKIYGEVTLDDVEKAIFESVVYRTPIIVSLENFEFNGVPSIKPEQLETIKGECFRALDVIRVYTKEPGEKPSSEPLILKRGSTVLDVARKLHNELAENFKYARVWGKSVNYPGEKVGMDHVLEDKDVVEIRVK
ncbi:MAG: TGS domain-containing protein [Sulfolobales archaeon]|nr:TGS domain-containing protein [Sulfolobales archaeon]